MKRILAAVCLCFAVLTQHEFLGALEIELKGGANSMNFEPSQINQTEIFTPFMGIIGNLTLKGDISKECSFIFNVERDNLFQNFADLRLKTRLDHFGFEFGLFAGSTDFADTIHAGILGHIELTFPNILFLRVGGSSTIGEKYDFTGDVFRESFDVTLGFWLPYVLAEISAEKKSFTWYPTHDNLYRLQLNADITFGKTSIFGMSVNGGYQILSRKYMATEDKIDELSTVFAGLEFRIDAGKYLTFMIGGEMPFMPVATEPLETPEEFYTMFKAYAGVKIKIF